MRLLKLPKFNGFSHFSNNNSFTTTKKIECIICLKSQPKSLFRKITTNCNHELNICKLCVNKYITVQLDYRVEINCPFNECQQEIQYNDMKEIANKKIFERYDKILLYQELREIPEFRWCKNPRCNFGQIYIIEGECEPKITCEACGKESCYNHDIPWHQGLTCTEFDTKIDENKVDKATQKYIDKKTQPCPSCGVRIIKNGGCNQVRCGIRSCDHFFTWK
ncbi:hypothetical protein RhiirA5_375821 [Rhizophagus irregularis]|nr:hypothetical protein RirG_162380 [Rhizophagus irregularis DAOM 197198w]PKC08976.1 hypothetical protein RhiirA5_375821 [Rhizophagus irregularis]GBC11755.1 hypothetical protein GLOIN_2v1786151 [Rhizophagus irregularis DAOM 181602=DAOM 197198]PKC63396.1 hypothetical protein RhiirA1_463813 [Rhizophagus irregularis]PKY23658.1 hypothetical protein RhiirB3_387400 [Rhizophagus irregularis]